MGVEPTITAWEAVVLPLHYGRENRNDFKRRLRLTRLFYLKKSRTQALFFLKRVFFPIFLKFSADALRRNAPT